MKKTSKAGQLAPVAVTSTATITKKNRRNTAGKVKIKTAKIEVAPVASITVANPNSSKNAKHNPKFTLCKVSRTEMVEIINATNGKFFTSTHIDTTGNARTMNCMKSSKSVADALGMLTVYSILDKGYRIINPQTLTDLSFNKVHYYVGRKPKK